MLFKGIMPLKGLLQQNGNFRGENKAAFSNDLQKAQGS